MSQLSDHLRAELEAVAHDVVGRFVTAGDAATTMRMVEDLTEALIGIGDYAANEPKVGETDTVQPRLEALVDDLAEAIEGICAVQARKMIAPSTDLLLKRRRETRAAPAIAKLADLADRANISNAARQYRELADKVTDPAQKMAYIRMANAVETGRRP